MFKIHAVSLIIIWFSIRNHRWKAQNLSFLPTMSDATLLMCPAPLLGRIRYDVGYPYVIKLLTYHLDTASSSGSYFAVVQGQLVYPGVLKNCLLFIHCDSEFARSRAWYGQDELFAVYDWHPIKGNRPLKIHGKSKYLMFGSKLARMLHKKHI